MADIHPMLHGDEVLADSSLVDSLCPVCDQRRDWDVVRRTTEGFVKKCKVCGKEMSVRKASRRPAVETKTKIEPTLTDKIGAKSREIVRGIKDIFQPSGTKK